MFHRNSQRKSHHLPDVLIKERGAAGLVFSLLFVAVAAVAIARACALADEAALDAGTVTESEPGNGSASSD